MYRNFTIFLLLFCVIQLKGQALKGIIFEPNLHFGKIIKHTPKFKPEIKGYTIASELNVIYQTFGSKPWHQSQNYPAVGIALAYYNFGDKDIFGSAFTFLPNFTFKFLRYKRFHAHFRLGSGLAFLNKPYHPVTNPDNNIIGAKLNNITAFRLGFGWKVNDQFTIQTSASYNHFSNGSSAQPNLGINAPALNLGIVYTPSPLQPDDYIVHDNLPALDKKIHFNVYSAIAWRERSAPGGPKYPTYILSVAAERMIKKANKLSAGFEAEQSNSLYAFMKHVELYDNDKQLKNNARRITFFVADEILLGNISLYFLAGTYLTQSYNQSFPVYTKLGARYYLPIGKSQRFKIHTGIYMKSHLITAEYISYGFGVVW